MQLSPEELGLPAKFNVLRPCQEQGTRVILDSPKRSTVISSPTGSGKSLMMVMAALASNKRAIILTPTRGLQNQYGNDFSAAGMADIKGLSNYQCGLREDYSCLEGRAIRCPYRGTVQCPESQAGMRVATSRLAVTSYAKWLNTPKTNSYFDNFGMLILDECHQAVDELATAMQVVLNHKEVEETLKVPFLTGEESKSFWNWKDWAKGARQVAEQAVVLARAKIECSDPKPSWVYNYTHMRKLLERIATLALANPKDWIGEEIKEGWQFDPIRPARYAENKLFCGVPRLVFGSATVRPKTMFMLNQGQERFDFYEFPSDFDASRCPTYHVPTMRMDHRADDYDLLYTRIDQIMGRRGDRKGLIHTTSWTKTQEILGNCRYKDRMSSNEQGQSASTAIDAYKEMDPPEVLISPSIGMGYDFPGPTAEYQIVTKIPFQDGRSLIVKARQEDDKDYGPYNAMQSLVQTVGRIMRSKNDRGETFILDDHIEWFRPRYQHFAPRSFHQFFRRVEIVPHPPPKL